MIASRGHRECLAIALALLSGTKKARMVLVVTALLAGGRDAALGATSPTAVWRTVESQLASGTYDGTGTDFVVAWTSEVHVDGTAWMRIFFDDVQLGERSYVLLHAANGDLKLNGLSMKEYSNSSCILAGDRVPVELHVAPGDRHVSVRVTYVMAGNPGPGIETACGADDRVATVDNRVGRLNRTASGNAIPYCTAWRIGNGAFLTAGHCADFDPDDSGPMLPDGVLDINGFVEFNVPASAANGMTNPASTNDQYPVDMTSVRWRFDGVDQGLGKDWTVFGVKKNANTGLVPHEAYGPPFRITRELPFTDETLRVTGFGTDTGTANQTSQTATGPFKGEVTNGADIRLDHQVDTEGGNSGSPIIWDFMNLAIGIHTNGGCDNGPANTNVGTSFEVDALETAINDFPAVGTRYVDALHPLRVAEEGTLFRPYASLQAGINATPNNGFCSIYIGFYGLPAGTVLNRAMTLLAPAGGVVVLGN